jgi:hypothetical protein
VVQQENWVLEADHIFKICQNRLKACKNGIHERFFKEYQTELDNLRNTAWYGRSITLNAIAYVMGEREILNLIKEFLAEEQNTIAKGEKWSPDDWKAPITKKIKKMHTPAKIKASKYAPLVDKKFGNFKEECDYLFNETMLRKSKQGKLEEKERPKNEPNIVVLIADQAHLFTVVNMDSKLSVQLLKAHCLLELRSAWYHPLSSADEPVKQWLYTWNMWSMMGGICRVHAQSDD